MNPISDIIQKRLENIRQQIIQNMSSLNRTTTGKSVESLEVQVDEAGGRILGGKQWYVMERGKRPGKVPYNFSSIIREWIVNKGISVTPIYPKNPNNPRIKYTPQERGLIHLSGAIATKIMKEGTRLHREGGFDDILSSAIEKETEALSKEMSAYVVFRYDDINKSMARYMNSLNNK